MFERYHKIACTTCQMRKGRAPRVEGEDSQPKLTFLILKGKYGRSLKIKSNLELKIEKEDANCSQSLNMKPLLNEES